MWRRLRQHHGLEHATITLLSRRMRDASLFARSDLTGFTVFGAVDTALLRQAVEEALARLQAGERTLAVHPNCGTNVATAGVLAGVAALLAGGGQKRSFWWERLPSAVLAATLALLAAAPVGRWLQEHITTSSQVEDLRLAAIERVSDGPVVAHRVTFTAREQAS
jgi:hypothetical protein